MRNMKSPHVVLEPSILYLGTPVVLVSTVDDDGTHNLAPISSAFWLGWRGVLGIAADSKTARNLIRTGQCVLNLPSVNEVSAVDRIARTTGNNPVNEFNLNRWLQPSTVSERTVTTFVVLSSYSRCESSEFTSTRTC
jgi:flavin reductase (DIM6/NTAB) family NADH-FMN oxidoreductase RutF